MSGTTPPPPPEAGMIRLAREARGLTVKAAAARLPEGVISAVRWGQIERGYERPHPFKAARASDRALAHMAYAVGVTADQLMAAGRSDAAAILREIERQAAGQPQPAARTITDVRDQLLAANARLARMTANEADKIGLIDEVFRLAEELKRLAHEQRQPGPDESNGRRRTA